MKMNELTVKDKLFFFEKHFFTLDGLWMIETENKIGWDKALKIDLDVWIKLLKVIFRRLSKYLHIQTNDIEDLIEILTFRWSVEGWSYDILNINSDEVYISVKTCPYKSAMDRNPERHEKIKLICNNMCKPFYYKIIKDYNPSISLKRSKHMGLGADECDFRISLGQIGKINADNLRARIYSRKINDEDKLNYFKRSFLTLDGLWVIETENQIDFETALELDTIVWIRLYKILFRRAQRYLGLTGNSLKDFVKIIEFIWNCEGISFEVSKLEENETVLNITKCPYIEAMERNPERHHRIKAICQEMCVKYLDSAVKDFNPNFEIERNHFIGLGDKICDIQIKSE
jgi:hypothetical protein